MKAAGILETVLYSGDLEAMRDFYANVLGLDLVAADMKSHVFFRCGAQMLLIFDPRRTRRQSGESSPPPHGTEGEGHVCFSASGRELDDWKRHLGAHATPIESELAWPRGGRSIYFRDPAGNSVEIAEPRIWGLA